MMTMIQIRDFPGSRTYQMIINPEDLQLVKWEDVDDTLREDVFEGRTRWCELSVVHFMILISRHCAGLPLDAFREERFTGESVFMEKLTDLLCGYIRCYQEATSSQVEFLRIAILEKNRVNFDTTTAVSLQMEGVGDKPGLRVVK